MQKKKKWRRGINVTVSPEAHEKMVKEGIDRAMTLRELVDEKFVILQK